MSTDTKELETIRSGLQGIRVNPHSPRRHGPRDWWQVVVLDSRGEVGESHSVTGNLGYWDGYFAVVKKGDSIIEYRRVYLKDIDDESVSVFRVADIQPQEGFPGEFIATGTYVTAYTDAEKQGIKLLHDYSRGHYQARHSIFSETTAATQTETVSTAPSTAVSNSLRCSGCGKSMSPRSDGIRLCSLCRVCGIGDRGY